jgi:hypothetical protein
VVSLHTKPLHIGKAQAGCILGCNLLVRKAVRAIFVRRQNGDTVRIQVDEREYWNMRCLVCNVSQEDSGGYVWITFGLRCVSKHRQ